MTENEAKTKWCPWQGIGVKADSKGGERARCIGSACMVWRWNFADHPHPEDRKTMNMEGYCGLAGKP